MTWHQVDEILDPLMTIISLVVLVWVLVIVVNVRRQLKGRGRGGR